MSQGSPGSPMTEAIMATGASMGDRRHVQAKPDVIRVLEEER